MSIKAEEALLRRAARRQGLVLSKTRRRDPRALDYGLYALLREDTRFPINAALIDRFIHSLTLDDVRAYLEDDE